MHKARIHILNFATIKGSNYSLLWEYFFVGLVAKILPCLKERMVYLFFFRKLLRVIYRLYVGYLFVQYITQRNPSVHRPLRHLGL